VLLAAFDGSKLVAEEEFGDLRVVRIFAVQLFQSDELFELAELPIEVRILSGAHVPA
jgi:hypothetical protein